MKLDGFAIISEAMKLFSEKKFQARGRSTGASTGKLIKKTAANLLKRI